MRMVDESRTLLEHLLQLLMAHPVLMRTYNPTHHAKAE